MGSQSLACLESKYRGGQARICLEDNTYLQGVIENVVVEGSLVALHWAKLKRSDDGEHRWEGIRHEKPFVVDLSRYDAPAPNGTDRLYWQRDDGMETVRFFIKGDPAAISFP